MPHRMSKDCPRHAGQHNEAERAALDRIMRELPENQSGEGRHKCPWCAYERGYRQALNDVRDQLMRLDSRSSG